jgi:hypothetical protein
MHWHCPLLAVILHEPCIQTHDAVHAKAREAYVIKALLIRASRDAVAAVLFIHGAVVAAARSPLIPVEA